MGRQERTGRALLVGNVLGVAVAPPLIDRLGTTARTNRGVQAAAAEQDLLPTPTPPPFTANNDFDNGVVHLYEIARASVVNIPTAATPPTSLCRPSRRKARARASSMMLLPHSCAGTSGERPRLPVPGTSRDTIGAGVRYTL